MSCNNCCVYMALYVKEGKSCPFYLSIGEMKRREEAQCKTEKILEEQEERMRSQ